MSEFKIDLNSSEYDGTKIFNNGQAGLVTNVKVTNVRKRTPEEKENSPDYKITFSDSTGAPLDMGIYKYQPENDSKPKDQIMKRVSLESMRLKQLATALMGEDYKFPQEFSSVAEVTDFVVSLYKQHAANKLFDVYVTYGTKGNRVSQYLNFRYMNFISAAGAGTLQPNDRDQMERITPDARQESSGGVQSGTLGWS